MTKLQLAPGATVVLTQVLLTTLPLLMVKGLAPKLMELRVLLLVTVKVRRT